MSIPVKISSSLPLHPPLFQPLIRYLPPVILPHVSPPIPSSHSVLLHPPIYLPTHLIISHPPFLSLLLLLLSLPQALRSLQPWS